MSQRPLCYFVRRGLPIEPGGAPTPSATSRTTRCAGGRSAAQATVAAVGEDDYLTPAQVDLDRATWLAGPDQVGQVIGWILTYSRHDARHLGKIEALKGVRGLRGTATA